MKLALGNTELAQAGRHAGARVVRLQRIGDGETCLSRIHAVAPDFECLRDLLGPDFAAAAVPVEAVHEMLDIEGMAALPAR